MSDYFLEKYMTGVLKFEDVFNDSEMGRLDSAQESSKAMWRIAIEIWYENDTEKMKKKLIKAIEKKAEAESADK